MEGNMGVIPENSVSSFNKLIIKMILIGPVTYIVTISKEDCVKIKLWEQLFVTIYIFCRLLFCHWPTYIRGHEVSWTSWGHQLFLCCCSVARRKQGNSRIVSDVEFGIWFKTLMEFEKLSYFKYYTIGVGKLAWVNTSLIVKYWGRIRWGLNTAKFETAFKCTWRFENSIQQFDERKKSWRCFHSDLRSFRKISGDNSVDKCLDYGKNRTVPQSPKESGVQVIWF